MAAAPPGVSYSTKSPQVQPIPQLSEIDRLVNRLVSFQLGKEDKECLKTWLNMDQQRAIRAYLENKYQACAAHINQLIALCKREIQSRKHSFNRMPPEVQIGKLARFIERLKLANQHPNGRADFFAWIKKPSQQFLYSFIEEEYNCEKPLGGKLLQHCETSLARLKQQHPQPKAAPLHPLQMADIAKIIAGYCGEGRALRQPCDDPELSVLCNQAMSVRVMNTELSNERSQSALKKLTDRHYLLTDAELSSLAYYNIATNVSNVDLLKLPRDQLLKFIKLYYSYHPEMLQTFLLSGVKPHEDTNRAPLLEQLTREEAVELIDFFLGEKADTKVYSVLLRSFGYPLITRLINEHGRQLYIGLAIRRGYDIEEAKAIADMLVEKDREMQPLKEEAETFIEQLLKLRFDAFDCKLLQFDIYAPREIVLRKMKTFPSFHPYRKFSMLQEADRKINFDVNIDKFEKTLLRHTELAKLKIKLLLNPLKETKVNILMPFPKAQAGLSHPDDSFWGNWDHDVPSGNDVSSDCSCSMHKGHQSVSGKYEDRV